MSTPITNLSGFTAINVTDSNYLSIADNFIIDSDILKGGAQTDILQLKKIQISMDPHAIKALSSLKTKIAEGTLNTPSDGGGSSGGGTGQNG